MTALSKSSHNQSGITLVIGLIMLVLMTLLALSAMRLANTNLKVVSNEQFHNEAQTAAAYALDTMANKSTFAADNATTVTVNVGLADYTVALTKPACKRYRTIPKSELVTTNAGGIPVIDTNDVPCFTGSSSSPLTLVGGTTSVNTAGDSLCAGTLWEAQASVTAAATGVNTGAVSVMTEGLEQRMTVPDAQTSCI